MFKGQQQGFTALELIITMAIVAVLLTMGVPAFQNYSWNLRMKTAMDTLQSDLKLARGQAISHNSKTVICPAGGEHDCSGQEEWQDGWIVFTDINGDRKKQASEPLLKYSGALARLSINSSSSRTYLRFFPNGTAPGSNATIRFCDRRGAAYSGSIMVSNSGRIRLQPPGGELSENCP